VEARAYFTEPALCSNYRLHEVCCPIKVLQHSSRIKLARSARKIPEDADDEVLSTSPPLALE
jgi:hypothetical protein